VLLLALGLAACSPNRGTAFQLSMAEATRANGAGRDADAARAFERAAATAKVPNDAAFARQEAALAWIRAGDAERGVTQLHALADGKSTYAASAQYKLAEYKFHAHDPSGVAELERFLIAHPETGYARAAFVKVVRQKDETGAGLAWLGDTRAKVAGTDLEQLFAYEHARRLEESGHTADARREYGSIADTWPYPKGVHFDEALVHAAHIEKEAGHPHEAIALLQRLLAQRELSQVMGTYEKTAYAESQLEIARIYEGPLADPAAARAAYHKAYRDFPTSITRDDALWHESQLWQADERKCEPLRTLVHDFPDSRYVPCAMASCNLERPKNSGAPARCHEYLTRH
jgi:hypothetical protein